MRADPRLDTIFFGTRVGRDHDRAARKIFRELGNQFCVCLK